MHRRVLEPPAEVHDTPQPGLPSCNRSILLRVRKGILYRSGPLRVKQNSDIRPQVRFLIESFC